MASSYEHDANSLLNTFKSAAENNDHNDRKESRKRIRQHMRGLHWSSTEEQEDGGRADPVANPSLQLTWLAVERMHPKIFNGYSFEPEVVPESSRQYETLGQDEPLRSAISRVPVDEPDSAKEAKLKTGLAQRLWEQSNALPKVKDGALGALWYADWWFLDGWDDGKPFLDGFSSDQVFKDPEAKSPEESRFIGYWVTRTLRQLKEEYPDKADDIGRSLFPDQEEISLKEEDTNQRLECWFIKDTSEKTLTDTVEVDRGMEVEYLEQGFEIVETSTLKVGPIFDDGVYYHPEHNIPLETWPVDGFDVVAGYKLQRKRQEPKYPGGWRFIKRVGNHICFDGENPSANGELPLHWLPCYRTPGEMDARGVPDQVQDINKMIDILYSEGLRYVRTAMPGLITREGTLTEESAETLEIPGGPTVIKAYSDEESPLSQLIMPYQFPELPATHQHMIDRLVNMLEQVTGSYDLNGQNAAYDALSGEAVEQLETAANARNSRFRDAIRSCCRTIVLNMIANAEKYSDGPVPVDIKVGANAVTLDIDAKIFDVDDFERKFDVVIGSTDTLPQSGKARNAAILEAVANLMGMGPTMAPAMLEVMEVPEKEAIRMALSAHFKAQAQGGPPDPIKIKQAEHKLDIQKRAHESLTDGLEDFAKRQDVDPLSALRAVQYIQEGAEGRPIPDVNQLINDVSGIRVDQPKKAAPQGPPAGVMQ